MHLICSVRFVIATIIHYFVTVMFAKVWWALLDFAFDTDSRFDYIICKMYNIIVSWYISYVWYTYNRAQNQYSWWTDVLSIFAVNLIKQCYNLYSIIIWTIHTSVLKQTWNFRATYINVLLRCTHVIPHNRLLLIFRPLF